MWLRVHALSTPMIKQEELLWAGVMGSSLGLESRYENLGTRWGWSGLVSRMEHGLVVWVRAPEMMSVGGAQTRG